MAEQTNISWTDSTFNPWIGCMKVSAGCDFCYAEDMMDKRYHRVKWGQRKTDSTAPSVGSRVRTSDAYWRQPLTWNKHHAEFQAKHGHRQRVFCSSLADVFDNQVPIGWLISLLALIRKTPELDWLLLTKRPENIHRQMLLAEGGLTIWRIHFPNVWLGFTAEDQENFDRRWPIMQNIQAKVRFCSYEPALGPLFIREASGLSWVICGGESGRNYRPMDPMWPVLLKNDCCRLQIPFFMKQMSGVKPLENQIPKHLMLRQFPRVA